MLHYSFTLALFVSLLFASCSKDEGSITIIAEQDVYLEIEHINHAWSDFLSCTFLTKEGKLIHYGENNPGASGNFDWNFPDENGIISEKDLAENLAKADSVIQDVDLNLLEEMPALIEALEEDLTEPVGLCDDYGTVTLWAYRKNEQEKNYQRFLVKQCGDVAAENKNMTVEDILKLVEELKISTEWYCCG